MHRFVLLSLLAAALHASPAFASDGAIELNHTCATTTGCLTGDTPGYPITASAAGSYRLTSNLVVPASTNGIEFQNNASLDLGGFEIAGPLTCPAGACPGQDRWHGVTGLINVAVTNGRVRGFLGDCVGVGVAGRVERMQVSECADDGIQASGDSLIAGHQIRAIGDNGIAFAVPASSAAGIYRDNAIGQTGDTSVLNGRASGPNTCLDQKCGTTGKKFFYLTMTSQTGATADSGCAAGFHFASIWEIYDLGAVEYDTARGLVVADNGEGPPGNRLGWARSGSFGENCIDWTSSAGADLGTTAYLGSGNAWVHSGNITCNSLVVPSWCVQD